VLLVVSVDTTTDKCTDTSKESECKANALLLKSDAFTVQIFN